jgi:hypothetical protein
VALENDSDVLRREHFAIVFEEATDCADAENVFITRFWSQLDLDARAAL